MHQYRLSDLLDMATMQRLAEANYRFAGIPISILDAADDSLLVHEGWQSICLDFHRGNPASLARCRSSDRHFRELLADGNHGQYKCLNGLWHIGIPILVAGRHMASLFLSQFFYEHEIPDRERFIGQAHEFGYDIDRYLAALDQVPIFSHETIEKIITYDKELARVVGDLAERSLRLIEAKEELRGSEEELQRYRDYLEELVRKRTAEIGEHTRAEEDLFTSRRMLQLVLDTIPQRVFWKDRDSVYVGCNKSLAQDCGYDDPAALVGKTDYETTSAGTADRYQADDRKVMETGRPKLNYEEPQVSADGSRRWLRTSKAPLRDRDGRVIGILGMYEDITGDKRIEEELHKAQKLESVGLLAGGIAHDFNNLLTGILGNISLAKIAADPGARIYDRLIEAERASLRARELTKRLITFAKGGDPVRKSVHLERLLRDSAELALSGSRSICEFVCPVDAWPVDIDEGQISQVISNLALNADQAMPAGGIIRIRCENIVVTPDDALPLKPGPYLRITIQDSGIGIPEGHLGKIFDPYFTTKEIGRGLGLTTAYSIVKKHNGHIAVASRAGGGALFSIYLPAASTASTPVSDERAGAMSGPGTILVMDDEEIVRQVSGEMLKCLGYNVAFARDGAEALALYTDAMRSGKPFDVVLMDLTIPGGMGGEAAIKKLREIDPSVKALVSSGYSSDPIMADYRRHGFDGVVLKPYGVDDLGEQIRKLMQARGLGAPDGI